MRIQKWISQLGVASRREAERWIEQGRVAVNGKVIREFGVKIDPEKDQVTVNGQLLKGAPPPKVYWLLNKPDKVLTARTDSEGDRDTIFDLPKLSSLTFQIFPVGRLDFRTEGLLLLTNDGDLCHRLTHPSFHVPREYHILITGKLNPEQLKQLNSGIQLEDGKVDAKVEYVHGKNLGKSRGSWYVVTVHEGRNRLVRRMFEHFEAKVLRLMRVRYGDIQLPTDLDPGEYIQLKKNQIQSLRKVANLPIR